MSHGLTSHESARRCSRIGVGHSTALAAAPPAPATSVPPFRDMVRAERPPCSAQTPPVKGWGRARPGRPKTPSPRCRAWQRIERGRD